MKKLKVYYGFTRLTKKIVRKRELAIFFENSSSFKNEEWIKRRMNIIFVREQTKKERTDAEGGNRMFSKYGYFIDEKPFNGDINLVLEFNFLADKNNVKLKLRNEIRASLKKAYFELYPCSKGYQTNLIFN